jgi:hypothetical protein
VLSELRHALRNMSKSGYIHSNPLQTKWKLCKKEGDYFYSSASFLLKKQKHFSFLSLYEDWYKCIYLVGRQGCQPRAIEQKKDNSLIKKLTHEKDTSNYYNYIFRK